MPPVNSRLMAMLRFTSSSECEAKVPDGMRQAWSFGPRIAVGIICVGIAALFVRYIQSPDSFLFGQHNDNFLIVSIHFQQITRLAEGLMSFWDPHTYYSVAAINFGQLYYPVYIAADALLALVSSAGVEVTYKTCVNMYAALTLIHFVGGFWFFYLMCRKLGISIVGSLVGAMLYGFSAYHVVHIVTIFRIPIFTLFPAYIFFMLSFFERRSVLPLFAAFTVATSIFLSLNVQPLLVLSPFLFGALLFRWARHSRPKLWRERTRQGIWMVTPFFLGFLVSIPQLVNFVEVLEFVKRDQIGADSLLVSLPPEYVLLNLFLPQFGFAIHANGLGSWSHITETAFWMGTLSTCCIFLAAFFRRRELLIVGVLFSVSLFFSMAGHLGFLGDVYLLLTQGLVRYPARNVEGIIFYGTILSAVVIGQIEGGLVRFKLSHFVLLLLFLIALGMGLTYHFGRELDERVLAGDLALGLSIWYGYVELGIRLSVVAVIGACLYFITVPKTRDFALIGLVLVSSVELVVFSGKFLPYWRYGSADQFTNSVITNYLSTKSEQLDEPFYVYDQVGEITVRGYSFTETGKGHPYAIANRIDNIFSYGGSASHIGIWRLATFAGSKAAVGSEFFDMMNTKYLIIDDPELISASNLIIAQHSQNQEALRNSNIIEYRPIPSMQYFPSLLIAELDGSGFQVVVEAIGEDPVFLRSRCDSQILHTLAPVLLGLQTLRFDCESAGEFSFSGPVNILELTDRLGVPLRKSSLKVRELGFRQISSFSGGEIRQADPLGNIPSYEEARLDAPQSQVLEKALDPVFSSPSGYISLHPSNEGEHIKALSIHQDYVLLERQNAMPRLSRPMNIIYYQPGDISEILGQVFFNSFDLATTAFIPEQHRALLDSLLDSQQNRCEVLSFREVDDGQGYIASLSRSGQGACALLFSSPFTGEWIVEGSESTQPRVIPALGGAQTLLIIDDSIGDSVKITIDFPRYNKMLLIMISGFILGFLALFYFFHLSACSAALSNILGRLK